MSGIRVRITVLATAVVLAVLVVVAIALVVNQRRSLTASLDEVMSGRVDELGATISIGATPPLERLGEDDWVAQIVSRDGEVLAASPRLRGRPPIGDLIRRGQEATTIGVLPGFDDRSRLLTRVVERPDGDAIVFFAAPPMTSSRAFARGRPRCWS